MDIQNISKIAMAGATLALIGYGGYKIWQCSKKKQSLATCLILGGVKGVFKTGEELAKEAWKKGIKPGAVGLYKKGLKPIGKTVFNKALKPGFKQLKSVPKKLEHESQKAAKKTGKGILKGLKKITHFGF